MKLILLLMCVLYIQTFAYNQSAPIPAHHSFPKIETIKVEGDVTVFLKNEALRNGESNPVVFSDALEIMFSNFSVTSQIKVIRRRNIKPQDTDSIVINDQKGFPDPDNKYWLFNLYNNGISLYSVHPTEYNIQPKGFFEFSNKPAVFSHVLYRFENTDYEEIPYSLSLSNENGVTKITSMKKECTLGDSLARIPRLFAEYDDDPIATLEIYGTIPQSKKYSLDKGLAVARLSKDVLETPYGEFPKRKVNKLLSMDSTNVIAHIKFADYLRKKGKVVEALKHIETAKQYSVFNDYLITYIEARIFEKQKELSKALMVYETANEQTSLFTNGNALVIRKETEKKIKRLRKMLHSKESS